MSEIQRNVECKMLPRDSLSYFYMFITILYDRSASV